MPTYFVWRPHARVPFRAYRQTRRRPVPADHNAIGAWPTLAEARRVSAAANAWTRSGRRQNAPAQQVLFPEFLAGYADPGDGSEK